MLGIALLAPTTQEAAGADIEATRQAFLEASTALDTDPVAYTTRRAALDTYVLAPYLDYRRLQANWGAVDTDSARRFLAGEATTQLGAQFRREYLAELARRGDWTAFLSFDESSSAGGEPLRCLRARALLATGQSEAARGLLLELWSTGRNLPGECDLPLASARTNGWLTDSVLWQRLRLAADAGNTGLARYLAGLLPPAQRPDADRLARALSEPEASLVAAAGWPDSEACREATVLALRQRGRADVAGAIGHWQRLEPRFTFSPADRSAVLGALALYSAVSYRPDAGSWLARIPPGERSGQLLDWNLRAALVQQDWATVLRLADELPPPLATESRTLYWRARALAGLQRKVESREAYAALARQPNFHGFLAADEVEATYALCPKEIQSDAARSAALLQDIGAARALELHAVGWTTDAVRAWDHVLATLDDADRLQLVRLASDQGWYDRGPLALTAGDDVRHYTLRFPLAEADVVRRESALNRLDPAWAFALIRAESAWQTEVRSAANAVGLMQLLPATGRQMARELGVPWTSSAMLADGPTNIRLGTRYLAQQADRFNGSMWLASAAYNAGRTPVQRWWQERGSLPPDLFIEAIPYRETREYVMRVLAFSVIYDWRLNGQVRTLSSRLAMPFNAGTSAGRLVTPTCPRP